MALQNTAKNNQNYKKHIDLNHIFVSIVVPTYNEEKYLPNILNDLNNQTFRNFETIVSDAFSTDNTRKIAKEYGAIIVDGGKPAIGRNKGGFSAKGNIIIFLDADIRINQYFIENAIRQFISKNLDLAGGLFDVSNKDMMFKIIYKTWNISKKIREKSKYPDADGQFLIFKKDVFENLKGFNEKIVISEDQEIVERAQKCGYKFGILNVYYTPSERRYKKFGFTRVAVGSILGGLSYRIQKRTKILQKMSEKIYGGLGKN